MFNFKTAILFLGVMFLSSNLFADDSVAQSIDDTALTAKVKASLLADSDISSLSISVETNQSVVTLTCCGDTQAQIDKATKNVEGLEGVKSVENKLTICNK